MVSECVVCREPQVINNAWKGRDTFTSMSNASVAQCYSMYAYQVIVIRLTWDPSSLKIIGEIIHRPCLLIIQPHLLSKEDTKHTSSPTDFDLQALEVTLLHTCRFKLHLYRLRVGLFTVSHWVGIVRHVVIIWGKKYLVPIFFSFFCGAFLHVCFLL